MGTTVSGLRCSTGNLAQHGTKQHNKATPSGSAQRALYHVTRWPNSKHLSTLPVLERNRLTMTTVVTTSSSIPLSPLLAVPLGGKRSATYPVTLCMLSSLRTAALTPSQLLHVQDCTSVVAWFWQTGCRLTARSWSPAQHDQTLILTSNLLAADVYAASVGARLRGAGGAQGTGMRHTLTACVRVHVHV
jgi:hypothetical protein